jgi:glycosyltransferase involved in cell wall biosynthesis
MMNGSPLLVFADDWGRHPSSCQHLIRQLSTRRQVLWVNTIGTRKPSLSWSTVRRGLGKALQWLGPTRRQELPANLTVVNPRMWPSFASPLSRFVNRKLLARQLAPQLAELGQQPVAITTLPIVADLIGGLPVRRWIYYCVDDFSQWPGLDQATMADMERQLLTKVDQVVAVGDTLHARLARLGRDATLLTHGVDLPFWTDALETRELPGLAGLPRPLLVFFGVIDRRLDISFLARLGTGLSKGTILLVGPSADPDRALFSVPRLTVWPALPYHQMPLLARAADVLIMPYADLPVSRAMQPLKLKEYLATGKPVVVRDLPANRVWAQSLDLASTPEQFVDAVLRRIITGTTEGQQKARLLLRNESWSAKAEALERIVDGELFPCSSYGTS